MRRVIFTLAALLAFSPAAYAAKPATPPAAAAPAKAPSITVPQLDDAGIEAWQKKSNLYTSSINTSSRVVDSWKRYLMWVDPKIGPTGKERINYGLYHVPGSVLTTLEKNAQMVASLQPAIPEMDQAAADMAATLKVLHPLIIEALGYYDRKDYKDDQMAKGKEMHVPLTAAFLAFLEAYDRLSTLEEQLSNGLDSQLLAKIERDFGKHLQWQVMNVMMHARPTLDFLPDSLEATIDTDKFDAAIKAYAAAVREFDDYVADPTTDLKKEARFVTSTSDPDKLLAALREFRETYPKRKKSAQVYQNQHNKVIQTYNYLIESTNRIKYAAPAK